MFYVYGLISRNGIGPLDDYSRLKGLNVIEYVPNANFRGERHLLKTQLH